MFGVFEKFKILIRFNSLTYSFLYRNKILVDVRIIWRSLMLIVYEFNELIFCRHFWYLSSLFQFNKRKVCLKLLNFRKMYIPRRISNCILRKIGRAMIFSANFHINNKETSKFSEEIYWPVLAWKVPVASCAVPMEIASVSNPVPHMYPIPAFRCSNRDPYLLLRRCCPSTLKLQQRKSVFIIYHKTGDCLSFESVSSVAVSRTFRLLSIYISLAVQTRLPEFTWWRWWPLFAIFLICKTHEWHKNFCPFVFQ